MKNPLESFRSSGLVRPAPTSRVGYAGAPRRTDGPRLTRASGRTADRTNMDEMFDAFAAAVKREVRGRALRAV